MSSDSKAVAYLETKSLDGETNLKRKVIAKGVSNLFKGEETLN